mgnify:CR=1 FL=1
MDDDEEQEPYTAYDYWEEVYEETIAHVKYMMETPREEARRVYEQKLEELAESKQESPKLHRFFYNRGRSLDEIAYLMMYSCDREDLYH